MAENQSRRSFLKGVGATGVYAVAPWLSASTENPPAIYQNTSAQLTERVVDLANEAFPEPFEGFFKGTIRIGNDQKGDDRYAVVDGLKRVYRSIDCDVRRFNFKKIENERVDRVLILLIYYGLEPKTKAEVDKCLAEHHYGSAADVLKKSNSKMIGFYDRNASGLISMHGGEEVVMIDEKGNKTTLRGTEVSEQTLEGMNYAYAVFLRTVEPFLEEAVEIHKARVEHFKQSMSERIALGELERLVARNKQP